MDEATPDDRTFDLLAASLRANASDMSTFVPVLAEKLLAALPNRVTVQRAGVLRHGPAQGVVVELEPWRFAVRFEHGRPIAERTHTVRGIALKSEPLALDTWIDALTTALAELAATDQRERAAVMRLLT